MKEAGKWEGGDNNTGVWALDGPPFPPTQDEVFDVFRFNVFFFLRLLFSTCQQKLSQTQGFGMIVVLLSGMLDHDFLFAANVGYKGLNGFRMQQTARRCPCY